MPKESDTTTKAPSPAKSSRKVQEQTGDTLTDNVMNGVASVYKASTAVVSDIQQTVKTNVYPVKEYLIGGAQTTTEVISPGTQGPNGAVVDGQTFSVS